MSDLILPSRRSILGGTLAATVAAFAPRALAQTGPEITPFRYQASDEALADLRRRIAATRWPDRGTIPGWEQGPPLGKLQALLAYWREGYDWRKTETTLNGRPQFKTTVDGLGIHFLHMRSKHRDALPLIMTHGWPSTVLLFQEVIGPLIDPTAHGGTASDAFHLVIPSLPGFGWSDKPTEPGWNAERTARAWGALMQRLGYDRYVAHGGDWGTYVTTALAQQRAPGLLAIHLTFAQTIPDKIPAKLTPDQQRAVAALNFYREKGDGYAQIQGTRPQTIGYALADSPAGQAAWLYDIFDSGSGRTGDPERLLGRDHMLNEITAYWLTDTAASSARFYLEEAAILGKRNNPGRIDLPVGVSVFPRDLVPARSWAPMVYPKLFYWNELPAGGHFAQFETPDVFANELRRCFRTWRA